MAQQARGGPPISEERNRGGVAAPPGAAAQQLASSALRQARARQVSARRDAAQESHHARSSRRLQPHRLPAVARQIQKIITRRSALFRALRRGAREQGTRIFRAAQGARLPAPSRRANDQGQQDCAQQPPHCLKSAPFCSAAHTQAARARGGGWGALQRGGGVSAGAGV